MILNLVILPYIDIVILGVVGCKYYYLYGPLVLDIIVLDDMPIMSTPEDVVAIEERLKDRVYKRSLVITLDILFFKSIRIRFIYSLNFHGWGHTYVHV